MAQTISIGSTQHMDLFKAKLGRQLKLCEEDGLKIYLEESPAGKFTFLSCRIADCDAGGVGRTSEPFKYYLADVISDIILNHWRILIKKSSGKTTFWRGRETLSFSTLCATCREKLSDTVYWLGRKPDYPKSHGLSVSTTDSYRRIHPFQAQRLQGTAAPLTGLLTVSDGESTGNSFSFEIFRGSTGTPYGCRYAFYYCRQIFFNLRWPDAAGKSNT